MCILINITVFFKKKNIKILKVIGTIFSQKKKNKTKKKERVIGTIYVVMISFVRFDVVKHDVEIAPLCRSYGIVSGAYEVDKY